MNESKLIYECMRLLGQHGAIFRTNAGRFYTKNGKPISGLPKGFSDLLFIRPDGTACFIECKADHGKPTHEQAQFIAKMQSMGAYAGVARTTHEAAAICGIEI